MLYERAAIYICRFSSSNFLILALRATTVPPKSHHYDQCNIDAGGIARTNMTTSSLKKQLLVLTECSVWSNVADLGSHKKQLLVLSEY